MSMSGQAGLQTDVNSVTIDDVYHLLEKVLRTDIVPFLWGPPGIGKSSIVKDIAEANDWKFIDLRLSLLSPVDLRGLPVLDKEKNQVNWFPPSFLPKEDTKEMGLLFLDEINLAPNSVQAAAYQLILDKKVGEYKFPKSWKIIAAGNREQDKANVYRVSAPLLNRFVHFDVQPDFEVFKTWAKTGNIRKDVLKFLKIHKVKVMLMPEHEEKAFPTPRTWKFLSDLLDAFEYTGGELSFHMQQTIRGTIGDAVGDELIATLEATEASDLEEKIENFIKTGRISLPKNQGKRFTLVMNVYEAYLKEKIDKDRLKVLFDKITPEEKAALEAWEEKNKSKIAAQFKGPKVEENAAKTVLTRIAHPGSTTFSVRKGEALREGVDLLIWDTYGNKEIISCESIENKKLFNVQRGLQKTQAIRWEPDAKIQVFSGKWKK